MTARIPLSAERAMSGYFANVEAIRRAMSGQVDMDDVDDKDIIKEALQDLKIKNKIIWFNRCDYAFNYLKTNEEQPFIILSDINLPGVSGIEFKKQIDNDLELRRKSIPFIFYSTSANRKEVNEAYIEMSVQGFFIKSSSYREIKRNLSLITEYWKNCIHPNTV